MIKTGLVSKGLSYNIGKVPGERPFGFLWKSIALLWNHVSILSSLGSRRPCGNFPGEPDMPMVIDWSHSGESHAPTPPPTYAPSTYCHHHIENDRGRERVGNKW